MPYSTGHVPQWRLELLAEGSLPPTERAAAQAHVEGCARCAAELEGYRALAAALSGLPRFAPSPGFADAVMARVSLQARSAPAWERALRWLPDTPRGWMMLGAGLLAPLAPLAVALAWLLSHPMITVGGLWSMGTKWLSEAFWGLFARGLDAVVRSGAWGWGEAAAERTWQLATGELSLVTVFMALAIPVATWSLVRLLRTPAGENVAHAH